MGDSKRGETDQVPIQKDHLEKVSLDELREKRLQLEREWLLSEEGFLDFVRQSGAAPDAEYQPHGKYAQDLVVWDGEPDPDKPDRILYKWKLTLWPRGSFKSQVFNVGQVAWLIARDPNVRILVCSETDRQAKKFVQEAMKIVESEWFVERFGQHRGKNWKIGSGSFESALRTRKGVKDPTLQASGVGAVQTGSHWDVVLMDDICSQENTKTPEAIESLWNWFGETLAQLDPGCKLFMIGTLHHYADIYCRIMKEPEIKKLFHVSKYGWCEPLQDPNEPIGDEAKLFFPGRLTPKFVASQKAIMPPRLFACFYENRPTTGEQQMFRPEYFHVIPDHNIPLGVWGYILTDFAFIAEEKKKDRADRTCFWVVVLDANRYAYVVDFHVGRWKPSDSVRLLCKLWDQWSQTFTMKGVTVERTSHNELIASLLEEIRRETMVRPKLIDIDGRSQEIKDMRIEAAEPRFRAGNIYFAQTVKDQYFNKWKPMIEEMTEWPFSQHDDIPDAISDLDKRDKEGSLYLPGPPPGWVAQPFRPMAQPIIDGNFNPEYGYPAREFIKADQRGDDLWRSSRSTNQDNRPFGAGRSQQSDDIFQRRMPAPKW